MTVRTASRGRAFARVVAIAALGVVAGHPTRRARPAVAATTSRCAA